MKFFDNSFPEWLPDSSLTFLALPPPLVSRQSPGAGVCGVPDLTPSKLGAILPERDNAHRSRRRRLYAQRLTHEEGSIVYATSLENPSPGRISALIPRGPAISSCCCPSIYDFQHHSSSLFGGGPLPRIIFSIICPRTTSFASPIPRAIYARSGG